MGKILKEIPIAYQKSKVLEKLRGAERMIEKSQHIVNDPRIKFKYKRDATAANAIVGMCAETRTKIFKLMNRVKID